MKNKSIFILLLIMLIVSMSLTGCDETSNKKEVSIVPTYQGMTIIKENGLNDLNKSVLKKYRSSNNFKRDCNNRVEIMEKDIEEIVSIDVDNDDEVKYYVQPNEVFIIEIHISNPHDFEIQSFTLNDKKYANYMFKDGSTMELLLLEVTAPSTSGYIEYTIDAIKYIDGTEIKDVDMSSGNKSIKAGVAYSKAPTAKIVAQDISTTYINLEIDISDPENLIKNNELLIYLTDGQKVVDKKTLNIGRNTVSFKNLSMSTAYEYGVVTAFDLVDGRDIHSDWLVTNTFTTLGAFTISDVDVRKTSIEFSIARIGEVGKITSILLYDSNTNELVDSGDSAIRSFTNLLSNHTYNLFVCFEYTINDELISDSISCEGITTVAKVEPSLSFESITSDKTSISYSISTEDSDGILNITKVELIKNEEAEKENDSSLKGSFTNLLSNNNYTVKVSYTFDLNDGQGSISKYIENEITTVAKVKPLLSISNDNISDSSINAEFDVMDEDSTGIVNSIELYNGDQIVSTNNENKISFNSLDYYTDYKVIINYSYDLCDGLGTQNDRFEKSYRTFPYLGFKNCKIINTSAVSEGDIIYMQVSLDNPLGVFPSSVVINGETYNCSSSTTTNKIYVDVANNGQYEGGNTTLTIERVNMTLNGVNYWATPTQNNSGTVYINGAFDIVSLSYINSDFEEIEWCFPSEEVYILLTVSNKTDYTLDDVMINGEKLVPNKIDNNHYYFVFSKKTGFNTCTLSSLTYKNDYITKTLNSEISSGRMYCVYSEKINYISSPDDLKDMNNGYYYELSNDIDLEGIEWSGNNFCGVFDGKNHSIKNMTFVSSIKSDSDKNLGLFAHSTGIISNLNIKNATYIASFETTKSDVYFYVGFICSKMKSGIIRNCCVDIDSSMLIKLAGTYSSYVYVGSVCGYSENTLIDQCANYACITGDTISTNTHQIYSGGICGSFFSSIISNCANYASVTNNVGAAGGIAGHGSGRIKNCINTGDIHTFDEGCAGICSVIDGDCDCYAEGCVNTGSITTVSSYMLGGICGMEWNGTNVNCYSLPCYNNKTEKQCSLEQINSSEFYELIGWDTSLWFLDDINYSKGSFPSLKCFSNF